MGESPLVPTAASLRWQLSRRFLTSLPNGCIPSACINTYNHLMKGHLFTFTSVPRLSRLFSCFPFQHVISTLPAERFHLRDDPPYSIARSRVRRRGGARYCGRPQDRRFCSALWP